VIGPFERPNKKKADIVRSQPVKCRGMAWRECWRSDEERKTGVLGPIRSVKRDLEFGINRLY